MLVDLVELADDDRGRAGGGDRIVGGAGEGVEAVERGNAFGSGEDGRQDRAEGAVYSHAAFLSFERAAMP